jgi:hypothetical protein
VSVLEELADALARDVIQAAQDLGDEDLVAEIGKVLGASSTTTQEAYMTAVRVRLSEQRARRALAERIARGRAAGSSPAPRPT